MPSVVKSTAPDDAVIVARGLGKKFCRDLKRSLIYGVRDIFSEICCDTADFGTLREMEFWALHAADFTLARGQSLGIIGHNGAGKSTLLKLIAGLIKPDTGELRVRGRVGALIALGAGFNPILTGYENIQVSAALLGYSRRQLAALIDDVIEFSELSEFIHTPVQNYSSGMHVRLGFAVAVHFAPDIMLVDEVLAVGDSLFQRKCFDRILSMREAGTSFIIVSHSPWQIEGLCDLAAVVERGRLSPIAPAKEAQALYHDLRQQAMSPNTAGSHTTREGTHSLYVEQVTLEHAANDLQSVVSGQPLAIVARVRTTRPLHQVRLRFEICSASNTMVAMLTTNGLSEALTFDGEHQVRFSLEACQLTSGWYYIDVIAVDRFVRLDTWRRALEFKVLLQDDTARNLTGDLGTFVCAGHWEFD